LCAEESDEDMFMVPDLEERSEETKNAISQGSLQSSNNNNNGTCNGDGSPAKRRRGRNPIDKEYRRLKRYFLFPFTILPHPPFFC